MRISSKSRYALQAMVYLCETQEKGRYVAAQAVAERFAISKIFLEQVFSALKKAGLLKSAKGAQGGYTLSRPCERISAYDILSVTETSLFEKTETETEADEANAAGANAVADLVCGALDGAVREALSAITLRRLADEAARGGEGYMYYL